MNYLKESVLRIRVMLAVIKQASYQLVWLFGIVGASMIYFGLDGSFLFKFVFFIEAFMLILCGYVALCFVLFRFTLRSDEAKANFLALSDPDRGKKIGDILTGW